ncbi:helix-turn-helix domain-containing protein [Lactobacillus helveticus]|uniref:helix-turn-helix domain-containing protein n=1 Tax=Lactobacillus helveticus TaxID=1587 RepID=UPI00062A8B57|nr:helix-turn-helix transcriptional regulator [Lactobacillus helveticus]AKG67599.1 transcriptional regulator [Lactobacillus helveticus]
MSLFSNRLEQARKKAGWTKTYVASRLKLPLTTYANYEYGKREPDIDTITAISTLFNTSNDYLMGKTDDPSPMQNKTSSNTALTWADLGMPYGGKIPDELKQTYVDLAESYFKRHPEMLNKNNK